MFSDYTYFDPYIIYDKLWRRFYMVAIANKYYIDKSYYAIAISKTGGRPRTRDDWCFFFDEAGPFGTTQTGLAADRISTSAANGHLTISANMFNHDSQG